MVARRQRGRVVLPLSIPDLESNAEAASMIANEDLTVAENNASHTLMPATSNNSLSLHLEQDLTLARLRLHGFELLHTCTDNPKALVPRANERQCNHDSVGQCGFGISIRLGLQQDGTVLFVLDLDGHTPIQDPDSALRMLWERMPGVMAKCAVKRSTSGTGYAVLGRSPP